MRTGVSGALTERRGSVLVWLATFTGFVFAYYAGLVVAAALRFREFPNYVNVFDWPYNVGRILDGTPALSDAWRIIGDEWLVDIGRMNYDYGTGVAEWAVTVITAKSAMILMLGTFIATAVLLVRKIRRTTGLDLRSRNAIAAAAAGALLVGLGNATLHWAVACASPSWTASLAMLGMSPALANWMEPAGDYVTAVGFLLLVAAVALLVRHHTDHSIHRTTEVSGHA